jgi:hypothetical protein
MCVCSREREILFLRKWRLGFIYNIYIYIYREREREREREKKKKKL